MTNVEREYKITKQCVITHDLHSNVHSGGVMIERCPAGVQSFIVLCEL